MAADMHALVAPYALHALDEGEEREFEEHLTVCEACRRDLAGLREAATALAYAAPPAAPPPGLKERILAEARSERSNVVPIRRRRKLPLTAAAAVAAAAVVAIAIWAALPSGHGDQFASVLSQPGARFFSMGARGGLAVAPDGQAALAVALPPAPVGKTYEAWVIRGGDARPAGLFPGHSGASIVKLSLPVGKKAVVAVTVERKGGASKPTTKPVAASGQVE
jgi:anti-sigma-K factor RskA